MSDVNSRRTGLSGGILVALLVGCSTIAVISWYVHANRSEPEIDASGFNFNSAPQSLSAAPSAPASPETSRPPSSLSLMKDGAGSRIKDSSPSSSAGRAAAAPPSKNADAKEQVRVNFRARWRENESEVFDFWTKTRQKYPVVRQYEKDWMSRPDLRRLTENYYRHGRDPVAFLMGLAQTPSFGLMVKQYAGSPWIAEVVAQFATKNPDLTSSTVGVLSSDAAAKALVADVTGLAGDPAKVDQK